MATQTNYGQEACKKNLKRRRWSKWHEEPLFSQLRRAVVAVRFENKTVTQASRESLPFKGCTQQIPQRTLTRHVAMSRDEPGTFLYMSPNECELQKMKSNAVNNVKRMRQHSPNVIQTENMHHQSNVGAHTQQTTFGGSAQCTQRNNFGTPTRHNNYVTSQHNNYAASSTQHNNNAASTQHNNYSTSTQHSNYSTSTQHNNYLATATQDDFACSGQQDSFVWSDADFLNDQMDCQMECVDPCSSNQQDQMPMDVCQNECASTPSCSTQGDWSCDPSTSCVPATTPPPLHRDFSNSSLCSNLSFGSFAVGCDINGETDMFGDNAGNDSYGDVRNYASNMNEETLSLSPLSVGSAGDFDSDLEMCL